MFLGRLKITAHGTERLGAGESPKAATDLLLQLGHAQVSFGLVVVEGHGGLGPVAGDLVALVTEPAEQVGSVAVSTAGSVAGRQGGDAPVDQLCITVTVGAELARAEAGPALGLGALDGDLSSTNSSAMSSAQARWRAEELSEARSLSRWAQHKACSMPSMDQ